MFKGIYSGQAPTESLRTQDSENVFERWVQQIFAHVLVAQSWVSATKWGPLAKLCGVKKNRYGHNFQNNFSYQSSLLEHPTRRQNFANTLQPHCA